MRLPAVFLILVIIVSGTARAREARITVLATSDLHGNVLPWDYLSGEPVRRGLASIATIINRERDSAPGALLVDAGDTIQGAPMETVWQTYVRTGKLPMNLRWEGPPPAIDPMMLVMNHLRYDSMTLGNHEFNYGLANLERARSEAKFPWLSANTKVPAGRKPVPSADRQDSGRGEGGDHRCRRHREFPTGKSRRISRAMRSRIPVLQWRRLFPI